MIQTRPELQRVALVEGCRTPFLRAGTDFADSSTYDRARAAVASLLHRAPLDPGLVDLLVMGRVVPDPQTTNLGREVVFGTDLPDRCAAHTLTLACVSSLQSTLDVVRAIQTGDARAGIAAGVETLSDAPLRLRRPLRKRLIASQKARGLRDYLGLLRGLRPRDLAPEPLAIAERSTGETMGQNGERLAARLGIGRAEQDRFACESHHRAARAAEEGLLEAQIEPVFVPPRYQPVRSDNGVRGDTSLEKLAALRPSFRRHVGTITAGNASFLSDGAAALLLLGEGAADESGCEPLAFVRSTAVVGLEPYEELLLGPALALPRALERAGLELEDCGVVELHEAFAAQVLAVLAVLEDPDFCRERLARPRPVGPIDPARLNAWGGSLSIGHPFGATGARLVLNCAHRMRHEGARYGVLSACAGGAVGIAMVLERP